jgi:hypothetical protein
VIIVFSLTPPEPRRRTKTVSSSIFNSPHAPERRPQWLAVSIPCISLLLVLFTQQSDGDTDLISLAESPIETSTPGLLSPASFGSAGKMALDVRCNGSQRDSFSDLVGAMKAKKPYTPIPTPTPPSSLSMSITSNGKLLQLSPPTIR